MCPWTCDTGFEMLDGSCVPTCASWSGKCDTISQVTLGLTVLCGADCNASTCCEEKATCSLYTDSGTCALVTQEATAGKVWAPTIAPHGQDLYCTGIKSDKTSCEAACCSLQSCRSCPGQFYITGCEAGTIGLCTTCPNASSCPAGQYQTCGDGVLSECQTCVNAPSQNSHYTQTSMKSLCPWKCNDGYVQVGESCVPTCASWLGTCDLKSQVALPLTTQCAGNNCSTSTCCEAKALCSSYTSSGSCALVTMEAADGKVWAPTVAPYGEDLYCAGVKRDKETCESSCCSLQSCQNCPGQFYTTGCEAGTIGKCTACPQNSSCQSGQYQTCGDGTLSQCQNCANAPSENSYYLQAAMTSKCPWQCDEGYKQVTGKSGKVTCEPTCSLHNCAESGLIPIPDSDQVLQAANNDDVCCQSPECPSLSARTSVPTGSFCEFHPTEYHPNPVSECNNRYVAYAEKASLVPLFTPCVYDEDMGKCKEDCKPFRNCILGGH